MEKINATLNAMLKDRGLTIECKDFDSPVTLVNDSLVVIKIEEPKVGINSVKYISTSMESYNVKHAIVLYSNSITAFAKNGIQTLISDGKTVEFFLYQELMYNVTRHVLVPQHILLTPQEKQKVLRTYKVSEKKVPYILHTDPVSRYYNVKPGQMFKIIRNSDVTCKSISYRIVV